MNSVDTARGEKKNAMLRVGAPCAFALAIGLIAFVVLQPPQARSPETRAAISPDIQPGATTPARHVARVRPIQFEANLGQAGAGARFIARGPDFSAQIFDDGVQVSRPAPGGDTNAGAAARLRFVGARTSKRLDARERAEGTTNYMLGADASKWLHDVPSYRQLRQAGLYPGIDLVYYGRDSAFEYDLVVQPGADPSRIRIAVTSGTRPVIDAQGDLLLDGAAGSLRMHRPVLYQHIDGEKKVLDGEYVMLAANEVGFRLPAYDHSRPLIIDPTFKLLYSTYLGGVHDDQVGGMVLDAQNNAYVVGNSGSEDWPVSGNGYQTARKAIGRYVRNVVVTKFDASGTLIYSTFIGGTTNDYGIAIAVDAQGRAYITGTTSSADFPVTAGAYQSAFKGSQSAYLAVLSSDGATLAYSTLYGGAGSSNGSGIVVEASGTVLLSGSAGSGLTTTGGTYKTSLATGNAAFLARFDLSVAGDAQLRAATYYGTDTPQTNFLGAGNYGYTMALDPAGSPWLTGQAYTTNLPVSATPIMASPSSMTAGCSAGSVPLNSFAYVAHLSTDLKTLVYASYLSGGTGGPGTCAEYGHGLAFDAAGNVYVGGSTSSLAYPTTTGALQAASPANSSTDGYAGFITKLKADGSAILWSTYLGGNAGRTYVTGLTGDPSGALWVYSTSAGGSNFPISADALQKTHDGGTFDAAFSKLDGTSGALIYSSFLGGAGDDGVAGFAVDSSGTAYIAGATTSANFPVTANAFQAALTTPAYDGSDWFFSILGGGTVGRLSTASAGNTGDLTLTLDGAGFVDGASCALSNAARTIAAGTVTSAADGNQLVCQFALAGAVPGKYDVVVTLPDGTSPRKPASFDITSGGQPEVWANVVGRPKIRVGVPTRFTVSVGNSGNVDAWFTVLRVVINSDMKYSLPDAVRPLGSASGVDYQKRLTTADVDSGLRYFSYVVPLIPAGKTLSLPLDLTSLGAQTWIVSASAVAPWFEDRASADAALRAAAGGAVPPASCQANSGKPYFENCLGQWIERISAEGASTTSTLVDSGGQKVRANPWDKPAYAKQFAQGLLDALNASTGATAVPTVRLPTLTAAGSLVVGLQASALFLTDIAFDGVQGAGLAGAARARALASGRKQPETFGCFRLVSLTPALDWHETYRGSCIGGVRTIDEEADYQGADLLLQRCSGVETRRRTETCDDTPIPPFCKTTSHVPQSTQTGRAGVLSTGAGGSTCGGSGGSIDPNDKSGPIGDGSASHFVRAKAPLSYQIAFENQPTASLPAAEVVVTDQLDPAKVDLSTLSLGTISFGSITVNVPPGLQSFATVQPIDATMSVRIQGSLNPASGLLKWTFATIDPATRLPPSDPTLGFLPPDSDGRKGQGQAIFNVVPRSGVADGTAISNQASIVFDANPAILTPTWVNTLDATIPVSKVQSLTPKPGTMSFDVAWSGSDSGSGISTYSVYVSDNGGPFSPWKTDVAASTATYAGTTGHTYGFYVRSTDGAGNTEAAKSTAEASVAVNGAFADPTVGTSSDGGGCTIGAGAQRDASLPILVLVATGMLIILRRRRGAKRHRAGD